MWGESVSQQMENKDPGENKQPDSHKPRVEVPESKNDTTGKNAEAVAKRESSGEVKALEDEIRSAEKRMIYLTAAIALFALCGVVVGILQWRVMSGQLGRWRTTVVRGSRSSISPS